MPEGTKQARALVESGNGASARACQGKTARCAMMVAQTGVQPPQPRVEVRVGRDDDMKTTPGAAEAIHGRKTMDDIGRVAGDATMRLWSHGEAIDGATAKTTGIAYTTMEDSEELPGQMVTEPLAG